MKKRDSFLKTLQEFGVTDTHEGLISRLRMEDVVMPDMRHIIAHSKIVHANEQQFSGKSGDAIEAHFAWPELPNQSLRGNGFSPERYLMNKRQAAFLGALGAPLKDVKEHYDGLNDFEAALANKLLAPRAHVASSEKSADVFHVMQDICRKESITPPRLIIVDSDIPAPLALGLNGFPTAVVLTSNLIDILNPKELRSIIAHELDHIKVRGPRSAIHNIVRDRYALFRGNEPILREELAADKAAVKATGDAHDLVDALVKVDARMRELKGSCKQMFSAIHNENVNGFEVLPHSLAEFIFNTKFAHFKTVPEQDAKKRRALNIEDPHPDMVTRFEKAFAEEERLRRQGRGGAELDGRG